jgi:hypothetical protein
LFSKLRVMNMFAFYFSPSFSWECKSNDWFPNVCSERIFYETRVDKTLVCSQQHSSGSWWVSKQCFFPNDPLTILSQNCKYNCSYPFFYTTSISKHLLELQVSFNFSTECGYPELPSWLHLEQRRASAPAFFYGTPGLWADSTEIEVWLLLSLSIYYIQLPLYFWVM